MSQDELVDLRSKLADRARRRRSHRRHSAGTGRQPLLRGCQSRSRAVLRRWARGNRRHARPRHGSVPRRQAARHPQHGQPGRSRTRCVRARYLTMHARGGLDMLTAGVDGLRAGAEAAGAAPPIGLAITVLTSDAGAPAHIVPSRVRLALECRLWGHRVCSRRSLRRSHSRPAPGAASCQASGPKAAQTTIRLALRRLKRRSTAELICSSSDEP